MMENNYYLYVFTNPLKTNISYYKDFKFNEEPFYVGISKNKYRRKVHFQPSKLKDSSIKSKTILKILTKGLEVNQIILYDNLTFKEACDIEIDFIKYYGRRNNKTGILSNITEGGEGHTGLVHSEKFLKSLYKPLYKYDQFYNIVRKFDSVKSAINEEKLSKSQIQKAYNEGFQYKNFYWSLSSDKTKNDFFIKDNNSGKPRYKFTIYEDTLEIKSFSSIHDVEKYFKRKVSRGNISMACNNKLKTYLGYKWIKEKIN